ncbi:MAG TPA: hydrogenase maturation nickel metallochaperone HypA, partial [Actinobacteria bacterium]|nr:hydrogenase maturation nickel metallochaperone HypA [Actinomycetota bacterium]
EQIFACPKCEALTVELLSGREFYVDSIEIE